MTVANGLYQLTETEAPPGRIILTGDIYFSVSDGAVTLTKKDGSAETYPDVLLLDDNTTIAVKNNTGASLPAAGGPGTGHSTLLGALLMVLAAAGMAVTGKNRSCTGT